LTLPKPQKPEDLDTLGLNWRRRGSGWVAYWIARADIVERGYPTKSVRLWPASDELGRDEPTRSEWEVISSQCDKLQTEMLLWGKPQNWDPRAIYNGTLDSLITVYLNDPDSPFQALRIKTKQRYESELKSLRYAIGEAHIPVLIFRDFKRWHENFCKPKVAGNRLRKARGHSMMTMVRIVLSFGAMLKLAGCEAARDTLSEMTFELPKRRTQIVDAQQTILIRQEAHRRGLGSIALAQAIMFSLGIRQKDALGEYIPISEPGVSDIIVGNEKWMIGMRWEGLSGMLLEHRISKSIRGRNGLADPDAGKLKRFDLRLYPMIMEELSLIPDEKRKGPMVVAEHTGLPWRQKVFAEKWREIARTVGIPDDVQNRDTRAGAASEAEELEIPVEKIGKALGQSKPDTTRIYMRADDRVTAEVAILRAKKNSPET
jgi:hypothetical protein